MSRNIALGINVNINGTQTAVKSIEDLEGAISELETELKTADFGSERFKQLQTELGGLKAGLRDIQREAEGVDVTQQFELFASSVNGITGAFLIATSAIQAFGIEGKNAEELNKIQARALAAVNLALGVRAVLEARVKFALLQKNLAEKASAAGTFLLTQAQTLYTVAIGASTGALKAFRIALATTGVGALVVGLGILISKLFEYTSQTEEAVEETKKLSEFQTEAAQSAGVERVKIEQLTRVIKQAEIPLKDRVAAYEDLQKLVPELAGYTLEEAESLGVLNRAINDQIELIKLRARVRGLEDFLAEQEKQAIADKLEIENQRKKTEAIQSYLEDVREAEMIMKGMGAATMEEAMAQVEARKAYGKSEEAIDDLNVVERELLDTQTELSKLQGEIDGRVKKRTKTTKGLTDVEKKLNDELKQQQKILTDLTNQLSKYTLEGEVSVKVLEDANEILEKQNELLDKRSETLKSDTEATKEYRDELQELFGGLRIPEELPVNIRDTFAEIFSNVEQFRQNNSDLALVQERLFEEIGTKGLELYKEINKDNQERLDLLTKLTAEEKDQLAIQTLRNTIGDESLDILLDYYQTSIDIVDTIQTWNDGVDGVNDAYAAINDGTRIQKTQTTELVDLQNKINTILANRINNLKTEAQVEEEIKSLVAEKLFGVSTLVNLDKEELELLEKVSKALKEQAGLYVGIVDVQRELGKLTGQITDNADKQVEKLTDISGIKAFIKNNKDKIGETQEFFKGLTAENSQLTEEQIANINNLIDGIKVDGIVDKIAEVTNAVVGLFTNVSQQISSIVAAQNSLLLEQLAYQEEITLKEIGDATEEQRAEQEIARKKYEKQRFDIEKSSRISELQFTLADTVANGASSIISSYQTLGYPLGIPLAAIMAGIVASQVATVNSQLNFTKSKQFVGRRGGLIGGASHELGGVDMGGGLNLEGGEFIMNRSAVGEFGDILSQMSVSTGGRPMSMDDSRIVEEIRKQNQRPIKTYVLDSDITEARKINSRLDEISRL